MLNSLFTIPNNERLRSPRSCTPSRRGPHRNFRRRQRWSTCFDIELEPALRDMEERVGADPLMNRTTRSVALTEAGELLLARVGPASWMSATRWIKVRACATCRRDACASTPHTGGPIWCWRWPRRSFKANPQVDLEIVRRDFFYRYRRSRFDAGVRYGRASGAGHDCGPAWSTAALPCGISAICCAAWPTDNSRRICSIHGCNPHRFGSGAMLDWEFEKAGRVVEVAPPAKLDCDLSRSRDQGGPDGLGFFG